MSSPFFTPISTFGTIPGPSTAVAAELAGVPQLAAEPSGAEKIVLTLVPPADAGYLKCVVYRASVAGQFAELADLVSGEYDDTGVEAETVYYYVAVPQNSDNRPGRPSRVAYARCLNWTAADFAFANAEPDAVDLDSNFGRLLYRTCQTLHGLGLFRAVLPFLEMRPAWDHPTCIVHPRSDEEEGGAQRIYKVRYRFQIAVVVVGQDDGLLALEALALRQAVKRALRGAIADKLIFGDVERHYDTTLAAGDLGAGLNVGGNAFAFDTGLEIEYLVQELRGQN